MKGQTLCLLVLSILLYTVDSAREKKKHDKESANRQLSAMDEEAYQTIYDLCRGCFEVPVKDRTKGQKSACVRYWRNKDNFKIIQVSGEKVLFFKERRVLKMNEIKKIVEDEFLHCKGVGSRKRKHRLNKRFEGVSEPQVLKVLGGSQLSQMVNARFRNKAISRPVRANGVQQEKEDPGVVPQLLASPKEAAEMHIRAMKKWEKTSEDNSDD